MFFNVYYKDLLNLGLIFIRVGTVFFTLPLFSEKQISTQLRVLLSVVVSLFVFMLIPKKFLIVESLDFLPLAILILKEIVLGVSIGFVSHMIFESIVSAANIAGFQMGFGTANLLAPGSMEHVNAFSSLHRLVVVLMFLALNLHQIFLKSLFKSFEMIPLGASFPKSSLGALMVRVSADIFLISLNLSGPLFVALLFAMVAMGLIARTVPQMNVFTMSFPVSFFIGLMVYVAMIPFLRDWFEKYFNLKMNYVFEAMSQFIP